MTFLEWMKRQAVEAWREGKQCNPRVLAALEWAGVDVNQLERDARKEAE